MKLSEVKKALTSSNELKIMLPNGETVPSHFHVTEIGESNKFFIDCGGTIRKQVAVSFQLWTAEDVDHRLQAEKLKKIIDLAEKSLNLPDADVEVEYQGKTIEKYGLDFSDGMFYLTPLHTDCLAKESCGVPESKIVTANLSNACAPGSGCC